MADLNLDFVQHHFRMRQIKNMKGKFPNRMHIFTIIIFKVKCTDAQQILVQCIVCKWSLVLHKHVTANYVV